MEKWIDRLLNWVTDTETTVEIGLNQLLFINPKQVIDVGTISGEIAEEVDEESSLVPMGQLNKDELIQLLGAVLNARRKKVVSKVIAKFDTY